MITEEHKQKLLDTTFTEMSVEADDPRIKAQEILTNQENNELTTELLDINTVKLCTRATMQGIAFRCDKRMQVVEEFKRNMIAYQRKREAVISEVSKQVNIDELYGQQKEKRSIWDRMLGKNKEKS